MSHDVSVRGHNLDGVPDAIESSALRELREISESYHTVTKADTAPVVSAIEVKTR
jgi:hypothetical protein